MQEGSRGCLLLMAAAAAVAADWLGAAASAAQRSKQEQPEPGGCTAAPTGGAPLYCPQCATSGCSAAAVMSRVKTECASRTG